MQSFASKVYALLLITLFAQFSIASEEGTHSIKWRQTEQTVEITPDSKIAEVWFTFVNESTAPMKITAIKVDCDCTTTAPDKKLYYPGENGLIHVEITIPKTPLSFKKNITVETTNAPNDDTIHKQKLTVVLRKKIKAPIELTAP